MIRVLHIVGRMDYGGAENRLLELARYVDPSNIYFDFCVLQDEPGVYDDEIFKLGFGIIKCKLTKNVLGFIRHFRNLLREGNYDVMHCHVYQFSGLLLRIAVKEGVLERIMHLRTAMDNRKEGLYRLCYRRLMTNWVKKYSTKIVANSQSGMVAYMGPQWESDPRAKIIYGGIDVRPFLVAHNRADVLAEFDIPTSAKVVVHVGNFGPAKNHKTLIRAAKTIIARRKDVHFLLVGDGPLLRRIRALVAENKLEHHVHFAGRRSDVPRLLMASDCFLFPSKWEGLPGAVLEALAAGLPVVASDIGPNREVAQESDRVRLIALEDEAGFAKEVIDVLSDPQANRCPVGWVPEKFRSDRCIEKTLMLYRGSYGQY